MKGKWKDNRGETLVEVLSSILIGSLSVALLFGMAMASGSMDQSAKEADKVFNESLSKAEEQTDTSEADADIVPAGAKVTVKADTAADAELTVVFYGGQGALSYALPPGGGG